uniref:Hormone-sensitive lipase n=1 Tax=Gallus gallus TaxID=9031 RepID=A0AAT9SBG6_CHICK
MDPPPSPDPRPLFRALSSLASDNAAFFLTTDTAVGRRFAAAFQLLRHHGGRLEGPLRHLQRLQHLFDLDPSSPGNGYRSLVAATRRCVAHAVAKCRYVAARRHSVFFRKEHNAAELEAYGAALGQLRALLCLAQGVLASSPKGALFASEESGLGEAVLREYSTMHSGCFYGRCLGFQFVPSMRPLLQTIAIGLVSYGEAYSCGGAGLGAAAGSLFAGGRLALDPELRGAEFERLTQRLDVGFWKSFWGLTESHLLASVAAVTSPPVGLCRVLEVPPDPIELPQVGGEPGATVTIPPPPVAHTGPGPVHMRLLSYQLREGQDSPSLAALSRLDGSRSPPRWRQTPLLPPSPALLVHFHGGGFVAQTSLSHEPYLRGWARDLGVPILSVDYSLAPEAPFPRALEECFYAYCWALRHCRLLGSTAQRVCLAGDSAGGNLCVTVALRAAAVGVQRPDGIMAAYPVTLVQAAASPSRLLTLLDPLLPLGVLLKCLSAYTGTDGDADPSPPPPPEGGILKRLRSGAGAWLGALLRGAGPDPRPPLTAPRPSMAVPRDPAAEEEETEEEETEGGGSDVTAGAAPYPADFRPLRSGLPPPPGSRPAPPPALSRHPLVSPLLAADGALRGLPPVHIVACEQDPLLDDAVSLARRLRSLQLPVSLRVVPALPHGFLSLSPLCPEARGAAALCTRLIRRVLWGGPGADLGGRRDSTAPLGPPSYGADVGGRMGSTVPSGPPSCGAGMGAKRETVGLPHSEGDPGAALPHGSAAATHSVGPTSTHGSGAALPHSSGPTVPHGAAPTPPWCGAAPNPPRPPHRRRPSGPAGREVGS